MCVGGGGAFVCGYVSVSVSVSMSVSVLVSVSVSVYSDNLMYSKLSQ